MPSLRGLSSPTCWKPSRSHQKWCDSSMSRTLSTRWFTPTGVMALAGALMSSDVVIVSPLSCRDDLTTGTDSVERVEVQHPGCSLQRQTGRADAREPGLLVDDARAAPLEVLDRSLRLGPEPPVDQTGRDARGVRP